MLQSSRKQARNKFHSTKEEKRVKRIKEHWSICAFCSMHWRSSKHIGIIDNEMDIENLVKLNIQKPIENETRQWEAEEIIMDEKLITRNITWGI